MKHSYFQGPIDKSDYEALLAEFRLDLDERDAQRERLAHALRLAVDAWDGRDHPPSSIDVAVILKQLGVDAETLTAALLSDSRLREDWPQDRLQAEFGDTVAALVRQVHWLNTFKDCTEADGETPPHKAETLRRMLLATVDDVRAVLIKLAWRVQRLRGLPGEAEPVRRCIARETLDLYAPLANRLGVAQLKWELEDLSFRHLEPDTYRELARSMDDNRAGREAYIERFVERVRTALAEAGIEAEVYGRPKHLYSIWKKMQRKGVALQDLADLLAVRVIVQTVPQCYMALGVVHGLWQNLPHEFDDYIAQPKDNGYQSLHTAVIGPVGRVVEVQIRTEEMHEFAEHGVAAHWRYKEGSRQDAAMERTINTLRRLLENREDDESLLEDFGTDLFADRVFVLTPKGDVLDLPEGATPLDFAYAIHTEVGHRCRGARVDGRIVPLTYRLRSGERVEVLTGREPRPSRDWMDPRSGYLRTARARAKVRRWFKELDHDSHVEAGREILQRELRQLNIDADTVDLEALARHFNLRHGEDLLAALGAADVTPGQLASALRVPAERGEPAMPAPSAERVRTDSGTGEVTIRGVGNLLTRLAECCRPVPGDPIIGYITVGKGVTIHRQDCPNVLALPEERRGRLVEVRWGDAPSRFRVGLHVEAFDREGLLRDVTQVFSNAHVNVLGARTRTDPRDQSVHMDLDIEVADTEQLSHVLDRINQIPNVLEARRRA